MNPISFFSVVFSFFLPLSSTFPPSLSPLKPFLLHTLSHPRLLALSPRTSAKLPWWKQKNVLVMFYSNLWGGFPNSSSREIRVGSGRCRASSRTLLGLFGSQPSIKCCSNVKPLGIFSGWTSFYFWTWITDTNQKLWKLAAFSLKDKHALLVLYHSFAVNQLNLTPSVPVVLMVDNSKL